MSKLKKIFSASLLLLGVLFLAACELDSISKIKADPYKYESDTAHLGGIVTRSYAVLNYGLYEIEDRSGKIFVVSDRGVPTQGAKVEVKGHTKNAFSLAGVDYGVVLMESDRKIHD
ncbi:MAG: hypothetical protein ACRD1R_05415 [Acidobacteriota bacterium]